MKSIYLALLLVFIAPTLLWSTNEDVPPRGGTGTVTIQTNPPNSDVFLDGEFLGKSPIENRSFRSGRHTLVVIDQGIELVNVRFNVWPNKLNVHEAKTVIPIGSIQVTTIPDRCNVYLNGDYADKTDGGPLTIRGLDAGDHVIMIECNRRKKEVLVNVKGEETTAVTINVNER